MRTNDTATEARRVYRSLPYYGGSPEPGFMSAGVGCSRDSDPLERSNYRTAAQMYRDAGVEPRADSFNHWAVGWVEELVVPISRSSVAVLENLRERLENYPVLDDEDYSAEEWADSHPADGRCYSDDDCGCGLERA